MPWVSAGLPESGVCSRSSGWHADLLAAFGLAGDLAPAACFVAEQDGFEEGFDEGLAFFVEAVGGFELQE